MPVEDYKNAVARIWKDPISNQWHYQALDLTVKGPFLISSQAQREFEKENSHV